MSRRLLPLLLLLPAVAFAQPASTRLASVPSDALVLPALDNAALAARYDAARRAADVPGPYRFAEPVATDIRAASRPGWDEAADGTRVWRLVVSSPGAYSLSFGFSRFRLPEGAALWIYPEGGTPEYRAFTAADNETHGQFWTPIVPGDRAVIELDLPATKSGATDDYELVLSQVNHAFRTTMLTQGEKAAAGAARSGSCNVDVVCPEGNGYRDIIRSVGAYTLGGIDYCSGAAINNTAEDDRPLFLTANHCEVGPSNAASVVVYWNYQSPTCRPAGSSASGGAGGGSRSQFNSGTISLGNGAASDWSILEFDDPILPEAQVFLAGWDRRDLAPASAIAIHHPSVEEKRISFENDATSITSYLQSTVSATATHIRITDWDLGTTEGGSSGSPLFNADKRIVGQLHGGYAACGNDDSDWYGRLYSSMNAGLAAILDPDNTGAETLDGKNYAPAVFASATASADRAAPGETIHLTFTVGNPTDDAVAGAALAIPLPAGLAVTGDVTASYGTASASGDVVTWTGTLTALTDLVVEFDVLVEEEAADGVYDIVATTQIGGGEPDLTASVSLTVVSARPEPDYTYEATPAMAIPDGSCPTFATSTIDVTDAFTVDRVSVGVGITHPYRGDLRVRLTSPGGTTVELINRVGAGNFGSNADNLDVLIDDASAASAFASGNHTLGTTSYENEGAPEAGGPGTSGVGALASFRGEAAQGTWTLGVCDGEREDTGTLDRWALFLVEAGIVAEEAGPTAGVLALRQLGENPATRLAHVEVSVGHPQRVLAVLVDATGREVRRVLDATVADAVDLEIPTAGLSAGAYFLRVTAEGGAQTLPLTVVR